MSASHKVNAGGSAMVSGYGMFHTNEADPSKPGKKLTPYVAISLDEIQSMVDDPPSVPKDKAQWVIPSTLMSRTARKQEAEGRYCMLWADFDEDPKPISEVGTSLEFHLIGYDVNWYLYSSRSATEDLPKSRLMIPLVQALSGADWVLCQEILNDQLAAAGFKPDRANERLAQIFFLPNRGDHYDHLSVRDGEDFDPIADWAPQIASKRAAIEEATRVKHERQEAARARQADLREASGTSGLSIIDTFNQTFTPDDFLLQAGYDQRGEKYRHPASQSGSYSASVKVDDCGVLRVHSLSSSDPLYTGGGSRGAHDAFSTFTVLVHAGDLHSALKDAGDRLLMIGEESWNQVKQREFMQQKSRVTADDFENVEQENVDPETGEIRPKVHPLAQFIKRSPIPRVPRWLIPGAIIHGIVVVSGASGVGKTSVFVPLGLVVAGIHSDDNELAPKHWRHVVYISEHTDQVEGIISGCIFGGADEALIDDRFHIVDARRMDVVKVASVGRTYREQFTRQVPTVGGAMVDVLPLVVLDTRAAVIDVIDENDNGAASKVMATLKQGFSGLPLWLIGHMTKAAGRTDTLAELSSRGAGAYDADAHQTMFLTKDPKDPKPTAARTLLLGKTRFEPKWHELGIESFTKSVVGVDEYGDAEDVVFRWSEIRPTNRTRHEAAKARKNAADADAATQARTEAIQAVTLAHSEGLPVNRTALRKRMTLRAEDATALIEELLVGGFLYEVEIPARRRIGPSKSKYLIALDEQERETFLNNGTLPEAKTLIPPSWCKPEEPRQMGDDEVPVGKGQPSRVKAKPATKTRRTDAIAPVPDSMDSTIDFGA